MIDETAHKQDALDQAAASPTGEAVSAPAAPENTPAPESAVAPENPTVPEIADASTESDSIPPDAAGSDAAGSDAAAAPTEEVGDSLAEQPQPEQPADESAAAPADAEQPPPVETNIEKEEETDDETDEAGDEFVGHAEPIELVQELIEDEAIDLQWYILKVASNRENSIADALRRRVKVEGLDNYFGQIIVPTEDVAEFKNGKKRISKRKLYPGYICAQMHVNDDTWFAVRDTPGIGDFTGAAGKPTPMLPEEVERILPRKPDESGAQKEVKSVIKFKVEDRVRIKEGTFENFEGDVKDIDESKGRVTVEINIFDRPTPVEIDHWQLESV